MESPNLVSKELRSERLIAASRANKHANRKSAKLAITALVKSTLTQLSIYFARSTLAQLIGVFYFLKKLLHSSSPLTNLSEHSLEANKANDANSQLESSSKTLEMLSINDDDDDDNNNNKHDDTLNTHPNVLDQTELTDTSNNQTISTATKMEQEPNSQHQTKDQLEHKAKSTGPNDEAGELEAGAGNFVVDDVAISDQNFEEQAQQQLREEEEQQQLNEIEPPSDSEQPEVALPSDLEDEDEDEAEIDEPETDEASCDLGSDFCGESASTEKLRQLKLNALEDVSVCEQSRDSLQAAKRLFSDLAARELDREHPRLTMSPSSQTSRLSDGASQILDLATDSESYNEDTGGRVDYFGAAINCDCGYDYTSSLRRRTLICSLSPTNSEAKSGDSSSLKGDFESQIYYPLELDEVRVCREAFRKNKHLMQQLERESKTFAQSTRFLPTTKSANKLSNFALPETTDSQSFCSNCSQRVYPVDRLELDFARTTLNIHRSCFKCQVCSSLLRLETYSALDSKLYCPAHIKQVTQSSTGRTQRKSNSLVAR